ncbi:unnamed protein product [Rodentolepis nana]|uniref:Endo/exonuclease/phosphatase domain-containing protein n=1 Tax=Rodentolepis nana TaxID=102285 RepID=A0A0R3T949_RODNA|nr:unnamed protein product [Rodentolepis nana]
MQYRLSEIDLGQQALHGLVRYIGDEMLASREEVLSQMHKYRQQIAKLLPEVSGDQLDAILEIGDPGALGTVLWLLKNDTSVTMRASFILPSVLLLFLLLLMPPRQTLKLATFNIQVFGASKSRKSDVMLILAEEIREKSGSAFQKLLNMVNALCGPREIILNELIGITSDLFERPPDCFVITPQQSQIRMVVMAAHLDPDHVVREMEGLYDLAPQCKELGQTENLIILGDMNADCNYLSRKRRESLRLKSDPAYKWLVPDEEDTTVASSSCAYDRIIVTGKQLLSKVISAEAVNFEEELGLSRAKAQEVSDHYPVEMILR